MELIKYLRDLLRSNSGARIPGNQTEAALRLIAEGNALEDGGEASKALGLYAKAIDLAPGLARAYLNHGNALKALGYFDPALQSYEMALKCDPGLAGAHFNIGNTLAACNRRDQALTAYRRAIEIKPDFIDAKIACAVVLQDLGMLDAAVASYRDVLAAVPGYAEVHSNLASVLRTQCKFDEALRSYQTASKLRPDYAECYAGMGNVLKDLGRVDEAIPCYQKAIVIEPNNASFRSGLLFAQNYLSDQPGEALLAEAKQYGELVSRQVRPFTIWTSATSTGKMLRVGLVSGDFCRHPAGYFVENVMAGIARRSPQRIELYGYASDFKEDDLTQRVQANCAGWKVLSGIADEQAAKMIHDDQIDILIDLSGHTAHHRLSMFAWKPAPVQLSWLGYFATTGLAQIDYLIADDWSLPHSEERHFVEKIWRLPVTRLCFTPPAEDVQVNDLPALTNGYITFGCFNHLGKINDQVVALWARVLQAVPGSRLFLKSPPLAEAGVRESITNRFGRHHIESERLIFQGISPRKAYLEAYWRVDIALDPFPYPGGATSAEALWMGAPVLTMAGTRFLSRQGSGILNAVGLPEWIAADEDDYVLRASKHASDFAALAPLRQGLRRQALASPLFDADQFAAQFETAMLEIWERHMRDIG